MKPKSPFYIVREFLSPLLCEQLVDRLQFVEPDVDNDGNPIPLIKSDDKCESIIFEYTQTLIPQIETYYNITYRGMKPVEFEWRPEGCSTDKSFTCENSWYSKRGWVKHKDRDLTCIIFLSDYNENVPFETEYEVYGGKIEFPQHGFGFNAERGTMVIYPSYPNFLNQTQAILAGDLFIAKTHIASATPFFYNANLFPGDFTNWF